MSLEHFHVKEQNAVYDPIYRKRVKLYLFILCPGLQQITSHMIFFSSEGKSKKKKNLIELHIQLPGCWSWFLSAQEGLVCGTEQK